MKKVILFSGIILVFSSCATKKVNFDQLQDRNGLFYMVNDNEPFTGEIISYVSGKVEFEGEVKNGLKEGLWIYYYANGQKEMEGMYKDGLKEGTWSYWAENGEQEDQAVFKLGNQLGHEGPRPADHDKSVQPEQTQQPEIARPAEPKPVNWDMLTGGPVKYYLGRPYTGPVVKWYKEGAKGKYIDGYFTNGYRSGKWTFYDRAGRVKDIKYY